MKHAVGASSAAPTAIEYAFRFDFNAAAKPPRTLRVFCFDSGYDEPKRNVNRQQLDWFTSQMRRDREQDVASPILAMIHIPVVEFEKLRAAEKYEGIYGERVCFDNDTGDTFAAFKQSPRVRAVFSGHDHENDYRGRWDDVELVYGRVSGWSGYGDLPRGGRLIEIDLACTKLQTSPGLSRRVALTVCLQIQHRHETGQDSPCGRP